LRSKDGVELSGNLKNSCRNITINQRVKEVRTNK
jgi:hypothetical protein